MAFTASLEITQDQIDQYQQEGYFILESIFSHDELEILRGECDRFVEETDAELAKGKGNNGITHQGKRYFIPNTHTRSAHMYNYAFSPVFAAICRATLGEEAVLFLDQMVVKSAEKGLPFSWHQDSGYLSFDHPPYLTCWATLDDVTIENGTVSLLPYSQLGIKTRVKHIRAPEHNDMVGYFGENPGIPVIVPAGSIAVFSSVCFHRSGPNTTDKPRRAMLTQYASAPILNPETNRAMFDGQQFLREGKIVAAGFSQQA
ncbi:MAG TPA: phytanoyl-CoA dioxygenase [Lentisphaeria bacterium]|nr:phytanoyl-CoA dioxygenase [Lentisphaeria bacterium]